MGLDREIFWTKGEHIDGSTARKRVRKESKNVDFESNNVHFRPEKSTFVHSLRKAHGGFRPLILLAKTVKRRESGPRGRRRHDVHIS